MNKFLMGLLVLLSTQAYLTTNTMHQDGAKEDIQSTGIDDQESFKEYFSKVDQLKNLIFKQFVIALKKRGLDKAEIRAISYAIKTTLDKKSNRYDYSNQVAKVIMTVIDQIIPMNGKLEGSRKLLAQEFINIILEIERERFSNFFEQSAKMLEGESAKLFQDKIDKFSEEIASQNNICLPDTNTLLFLKLLLESMGGNDSEANDFIESLSKTEIILITSLPNELILLILTYKIDQIIKQWIFKNDAICIGKALKKALLFIKTITSSCKKLYIFKPNLIAYLKNYFDRILINDALFQACFNKTMDLPFILLSSEKLNLTIPHGYADFAVEASGSNNVALLKLLFEHGADYDEKNKKGNTPLIEAIIWRKLDSIKFLLEVGASPYATDSENTTPLIVNQDHLCSDEEQYTAINKLLKDKIAELESSTN